MKILGPLLKMEIIATKRSWMSFLLGIGMPVAFFLFFSGMYQFDNAEIKMRAIRIMMLSMTAFSAISFSFFTLPSSFQEDRRNKWQDMLLHSPVPNWQYLFVRYLRIGLSLLLSILVVFTAGALFRGVKMPSQDWLMAGLLLFIGGMTFIALGLVLGNIRSAETLSVVGNILYLGLAMLGGMWFPVSLFPDWMRKIAEVTPTYHLNNWVVTYVEKHELAWSSLGVLLLYAIISIGISLFFRRKMEES